MRCFLAALRLRLLIGLVVVVLPAAAQTRSPKESESEAPGLRKLTGDDAKRAAELGKSIEAAIKADRWDEAVAKAEESLALRTRVLGPKHFETVNDEWRVRTDRRVAGMPDEDRAAFRRAQALIEEGQTLFAQRNYTLSQQKFEQTLEILRRLLSEDHPYTAMAYGHVATNLQEQGRLSDAQRFYEKALDIKRRVFTDEHVLTARAYSDLATTLDRRGKYTEAQLLYVKALEIRRRILGDSHSDTAISYGNLGTNLCALGKYAQAQPLYEKALAIHRRLLGDNNLITAISYNNLAHSLSKQGNYAGAQPLYEKALEIRRRLLTDNHRNTASSYNNLADNLFGQGKYAQAQPMLEKALEIRRQLLSDNHRETANSYNDLAVNLSQQGKYAQAQLLCEKALEIKRGLLGDSHDETAAGYYNLALNYMHQGKLVQSQALFQRALEIARQTLTDEHPRTATVYNGLGGVLKRQGKFVEAQPTYEAALEIRRRLLGDDHPETAESYSNVATNLDAQGKYALAQPLCLQALDIRRRLLTDDHPATAISYNNVAFNLVAQGKYAEARDRWLSAVKSLDAARLSAAFTGLERAGAEQPNRLGLVAVEARLGQLAEAWQHLEEHLGRGLLDELFVRQDHRLAPAERTRLRELTAELERLDKLVESLPRDLDKAERAKRFEELRHQREVASIDLGEFQTKLERDHGALAGQVAKLNEVQAALPSDVALVAWVDIQAAGPNAADPDGEHWGVVVRSRGIPMWVAIAGTGRDGLWTTDDTRLPGRVRTELRKRPGPGAADLQPLIAKLRSERLTPLEKALGATANGLPAARRLIVLPSRWMAGIPVEILLADDDARIVSYTPSATVFKYLRDQPRPDRQVGLLALGDPEYHRPDASKEPKALPDHGLLVNVVVPGSNAATHGVKTGDVLLAYNGISLKDGEDLKVVSEPSQPVPVEIWRDGKLDRRELAHGKLGVVFDPRPAPKAIAANRALNKVLAAARSGGEDFAPLPGTRYEVAALSDLFQSDHRPSRDLLGGDASEPELDRLATSGELGHYGFIHLATHGVIDEDIPVRSALILTQTGLPDPLEQALKNRPVYDGRLLVREIQRGWELKAELVTLSACETALGREEGGEGFVGFTQALLISGARSVCLSLWKVDDTATALLMQRFYANLLGRRPGLASPMPKAEALHEAKAWLRNLRRSEALAVAADLSGGVDRGKGAKARQPGAAIPAGRDDDLPYASPHYWAAFVLAGDPD
jgi:tetratricopeptide (TPR) repeat protein